MKKSIPKNLLPFIWYFLRPYRRVVVLFVCLAIGAGFWGPINNLLIKYVINILPEVQGGNTSLLILPAILIVLNFIIFDNFTWRGIGYLNYKYQASIKNEIIRTTLDHVLSETHQFFQNNLSGRIANQITILADNIELILHRISLDFIRGTSLLIVSFIACYSVNPTFFWIQAIWFICFATFSVGLSSRLVTYAKNYASNETSLSGQLVDTISNHNNVRIFARKTFELSRMNQFFDLLRKSFQTKEGFLVILNCIQGLMIAIMMGFAVYFLVHFYGLGLVTIGDFALILGLSMELGHMMWFTMSRVDEFNQAYGKCRQSLASLMLYPEIQDKVGAKPLNCTQGKITFDRVKFHYKDSDAIFQDKSVIIEPGEKVGLVGYSGGGKTTFVHLILRLYDITGGKILIDEQDIRDVTQDSLRKACAMIPQDPSLFHRSLMDNIRYGKVEATDAEVIEASKKAHAHEFIIKIPEGYASLVGERGIKLSGGQRQRIAIARAILKNAPILILDEATSQLDSVTENLIQESLWELMQGKTTLVIAHRLSTLLHMDRILVFDKGKIVQDGPHSKLLEEDGLYNTLWSAQIGGFLIDETEEIEE